MPLYSKIANYLRSATSVIDVQSATAPSNGQVLTATGPTAATWQTSSGGTPKIRIDTMFENLSRFTDNSTSGTTTLNTDGMAMTTTATTNRSAVKYIDVGNNTFASYSQSPTFSAIFTGVNEASVGTVLMGIGNVGMTGASPVLTDSHIGFKVVTTGGVSTLYGTIATGGVESATAALTTIASVNIVVEVIVKVNGTTSADFYWRKSGGALSSATTLTATMPSSADDVPLFFGVTNQNNANAATVTFISASYER